MGKKYRAKPTASLSVANCNKLEVSMRLSYFLPGVVVLMLLSTGCGIQSVKGYPDKFSDYNANMISQMEKELGLDKKGNKILIDAFTRCSKKAYKSSPTTTATNDSAQPSQKRALLSNNKTAAPSEATASPAPSQEPSNQPKQQAQVSSSDGSNPDVKPEDDHVDINASCRNELVEKLLIIIDLQYNDFRADLYLGSGNANFGADLALLGLSTASVISRFSTTQTILAALTGGISGARASFNKTYLFDQTMPALIEQMDNDRKQIKDRIIKKWNKPLATYPVAQAISDINEYFYAGTLPSAIKNLVNPRDNRDKIQTAEELKKISDCKVNTMAVMSGKGFESKKEFIKQTLVKNSIVKSDTTIFAKFKPVLDPANIDNTLKESNVNDALAFIFTSINDEETCTRISDAANNLK